MVFLEWQLGEIEELARSMVSQGYRWGQIEKRVNSSDLMAKEEKVYFKTCFQAFSLGDELDSARGRANEIEGYAGDGQS